MTSYQLQVRQFQSAPPARAATPAGATTRPEGRGFNPRRPRGRRREAVRGLRAQGAVSIRAARAGGDERVSEGYHRDVDLFQSAPPARAATPPTRTSSALPACFNPRRPRGRRQDLRCPCPQGGGVSIRAARAGGDYTLGESEVALKGFNPRRPRGRRRGQRGRRTPGEGIVSIRAARAGGDSTASSACARLMFQSAPPARAATGGASTKTPVAGEFQSAPPARAATCGRGHVAVDDDGFQSAPPARAATRTGAPRRCSYSTFQSAPPARAATFELLPEEQCGKRFQSAPPARAATEPGGEGSATVFVSIRAARAGGDPCSPRPCSPPFGFNPRRPRGRRPPINAGGRSSRGFNPRRPRGRRPRFPD